MSVGAQKAVVQVGMMGGFEHACWRTAKGFHTCQLSSPTARKQRVMHAMGLEYRRDAYG